jgi:ribulose-phosphate 3-epimerase
MSIVKLAPSILAADFARLGQQVAEAAQGGADRIHVDVMDGHFVPNLSMGAVVVESLRRVTHLPLEIHLMISDPDFFLEEFAAAGADSFLVSGRATTICTARCNESGALADAPGWPSTQRRPRPCSRKSSRTWTRCWS